MAPPHSRYRTLPLHASLEEATSLGTALLMKAEEEWRVSDLSAWLEQEHPDWLSLEIPKAAACSTSASAAPGDPEHNCLKKPSNSMISILLG